MQKATIYIYILTAFITFLVIFGFYNYFFRKKYYESPIFPDFSILYKEKKKHYFREADCRKILEELTGHEFKKTRPNFLKYHTGKNLELDGYNPLLNMGFEYNGVQHYHYTPYFHKSMSDFEEQQRHDQFKKEKCENLGIKLIEIPYFVKDKDLRRFIEIELLKNKFSIDNG
jgi:hypothetical protein